MEIITGEAATKPIPGDTKGKRLRLSKTRTSEYVTCTARAQASEE